MGTIEKENVSSLRKWEQAFRVYAAIYSKANPGRAHEIWQYIHVILTAASSYLWENVAEYDFPFRQLMSNYPQCSWAKIYGQMWNLAMRDPLQKVGFRGSKRNNNNSANTASGRDRYCWGFNKGKCKKSAADCDWEHQCRYCDG